MFKLLDYFMFCRYTNIKFTWSEYKKYTKWLNSKTSQELKSMYAEATHTPKSLFDFYKEETQK